MVNVNDKLLKRLVDTLEDISISLRKLSDRNESTKQAYVPSWLKNVKTKETDE